MKTESTISKINTELIQTFAALDAWFDQVLDDGFEQDEEWNMRDTLQHILISNHHVLDLMSDGYDFALSQVYHSDSKGQESFHTMRFALREQLYHCLCLLDEMDENESFDDIGKSMNACDKLQSITNHLNYHMERLQRSESVE